MNTLQLDQGFADALVLEAVDSYAVKRYSGNQSQVIQLLRSQQSDAGAYIADFLSRKLGDYLGRLDKTIKAVYLYEPEEISILPLEGGRRSSRRKAGINLVIWVRRKSAALNTLSDTLESLFERSWDNLGCSDTAPLYIQMVDDEDVKKNRAYGMLVNSMFVRSVPVWKRKSSAQEEYLQKDQTEALQYLLASFDPEWLPERVLFERAQAIRKMKGSEQALYDHHLQEIKVALIRRMISDQLAYINIAKKWLSFADLQEIFRRKIGHGRVGGKAAGLVLAARILDERLPPEIRPRVNFPQSYFIGSDVNYIFMAMNGLTHWIDQKYKSEEQIWSDYALIQEDFQTGDFPPEVSEEFEKVLNQVGNKPLIVRSSSQLEDNFGTAFAGKYESYFLGNQGSSQENLEAFKRAVARIYASTLKPDALLYRKSKGLQDYDERMAVLVQEVQGETFGRYFLPYGAGVAFSRNLYRWAPQIIREDGFMRLVWGLGTRAVERVGDDFPRLVALSHPNLLPDDSPQAITYYSQNLVDVIDLQENLKISLPVNEVLNSRYPALQWLVEIEEDGYYRPLRQRLLGGEKRRMVVTFSELLRRTQLAADMRSILKLLEEEYRTALDVEFTLQADLLEGGEAQTSITVLQCRPQSHLVGGEAVYLPADIKNEDIIFSTEYMVPHGYVKGIEYVVYVPARAYFGLQSAEERRRVGYLISQINRKMETKKYICVGPGRWGTTNHDLGVFVAYGDIDRAGALVEICGQEVGVTPEPSLGTHFFQDLMEGGIFPVALNLDEQDVEWHLDDFADLPNHLPEWVDETGRLANVVHLIKVSDIRNAHILDLIMDNEKGKAVAILAPAA